ncbi:hypothetical protein FOMA001_g14822 [Fusarium oxysporum f. sp. matthiolae]|nr:hypothetical protein FOMA001_g14822 [Fusarium oxysporum f. sp. matthiolae]
MLTGRGYTISYLMYASHFRGVKSATSSTTSELVHAKITIIES